MAYTGTTLLLSHISFCNVSWSSRLEKFLSDVSRQYQSWRWNCLATSDTNFSHLEFQETTQKEIWDKSKAVPVYVIQVSGGSVGMASFVLNIDNQFVGPAYIRPWFFLFNAGKSDQGVLANPVIRQLITINPILQHGLAFSSSHKYFTGFTEILW